MDILSLLGIAGCVLGLALFWGPLMYFLKRINDLRVRFPHLQFQSPSAGHWVSHVLTFIAFEFLFISFIVEIDPIAGLVAFGVMWLISMTTNACCSATAQATRNVRSLGDTFSFVNMLRNTAPVVSLELKAWHVEHRTRHVSYTDSDGNRQTRTEHYTENVTTARESFPVHLAGWWDATPALYTPDYPMLMINLKKQFVWEGPSEQMLNNMLSQLWQANSHLDQHVSVWSDIELPGFVANQIALKPGMVKPPCLSAGKLALCSAFFQGLAYSYWLAGSAALTRNVVVKHMSLVPLNVQVVPASIPLPKPMPPQQIAQIAPPPPIQVNPMPPTTDQWQPNMFDAYYQAPQPVQHYEYQPSAPPAAQQVQMIGDQVVL